MDTLLLASSSPRRRHILTSLKIPFTCVDPDIDESVYDHLPLKDRVVALAVTKATEGARKAASGIVMPDAMPGEPLSKQDASGKPRFVLGADTLVALQENDRWTVLGKPAGRSEAAEMTGFLAGKIHQVFTGIALLDGKSGHVWPAMSSSRVTFTKMTPSEIDDYLDTGDWEGAAGAYRIQGRASFHIDWIEGSWSGIMGLPIRELYDILKQADFRLSPSLGNSREGSLLRGISRHPGR